MTFQDPASPVMEGIIDLHHDIMFYLVVIGTFVPYMLFEVYRRFNIHNNPVPVNITHHTTLEIVWTVIPMIILISIALPSFVLLYSI
jgi:cytochrome c oxidase subunit 2